MKHIWDLHQSVFLVLQFIKKELDSYSNRINYIRRAAGYLKAKCEPSDAAKIQRSIDDFHSLHSDILRRLKLLGDCQPSDVSVCLFCTWSWKNSSCFIKIQLCVNTFRICKYCLTVFVVCTKLWWLTDWWRDLSLLWKYRRRINWVVKKCNSLNRNLQSTTNWIRRSLKLPWVSINSFV